MLPLCGFHFSILFAPEIEEQQLTVNKNTKGGNAILIPKPTGENIKMTINRIDAIFDVNYPVNKDIRYIHKVVDGRDIYYFANIGKAYIDIPLTLSGANKMEKWNPHNGSIEKLSMEINKAQNQAVIGTLQLKLAPFNSCFFNWGILKK